MDILVQYQKIQKKKHRLEKQLQRRKYKIEEFQTDRVSGIFTTPVFIFVLLSFIFMVYDNTTNGIVYSYTVFPLLTCIGIIFVITFISLAFFYFHKLENKAEYLLYKKLKIIKNNINQLENIEKKFIQKNHENLVLFVQNNKNSIDKKEEKEIIQLLHQCKEEKEKLLNISQNKNEMENLLEYLNELSKKSYLITH